MLLEKLYKLNEEDFQKKKTLFWKETPVEAFLVIQMCVKPSKKPSFSTAVLLGEATMSPYPPPGAGDRER
jgi:hypothetical protein